MRRLGYFLLTLGVSGIGLVFVTIWYLSSYQAGYGSMTDMMGQMMGNQYTTGTIAPMPSYVWVTIAALFALVVSGLVGLVYYLAFPEIRSTSSQDLVSVAAQSRPSATSENWETVLRTSKPEERKILAILANHEGAHLQKFIVKESGLSKLQTHRIVSRFVERGIVTARKKGNTNEISLAPWLRQELPTAGKTA